MFRKGQVPHNKGDTHVRANYRNTPRRMPRHMDDDIYERPIDRFGGSNPFKLNIEMSDLAISRNTIRSDKVNLF